MNLGLAQFKTFISTLAKISLRNFLLKYLFIWISANPGTGKKNKIKHFERIDFLVFDYVCLIITVILGILK